MKKLKDYFSDHLILENERETLEEANKVKGQAQNMQKVEMGRIVRQRKLDNLKCRWSWWNPLGRENVAIVE